MSEFQDGLPRPEVHTLLEPCGEVVLGSVDPRTLTQEEFMHSPDLLWHGSGTEFTYNPNFDLASNENDYGVTLGVGFYTTDKREEAALFSQFRLEREHAGHSQPIIQALLPDHARMFDFRAKDDNSKHGCVPHEMAEDYFTFFENYLKSKYPKGRPGGLEGMIFDITTQYLQATRDRVERTTPLRIRQLLSVDGIDNSVYGYAAGIFTNYMLSKGYDGVISIEGGDHPEQKNPVSYVFYNLNKIGTYESWRKSISRDSTPLSQEILIQ